MRLRRLLAATAVTASFVLLGTACAASEPGADAPTSEESSTRTVTTDYGDVEVPADPQKIVVLNYALAGYLYNLDQPVTATIPEDADGTEGEFSELWGDAPEEDGTVFLPWSVDGFDLEAILAEDPDLIIGGGIGFPLFQAEQVYEDLSDIAPTVLVGKGLDTWQKQFAFLAEDVFDQSEDFDGFVAAYDKRVAEVKDAITPPDSPAYVSYTADGTAYALVESVGLPQELAAVGIEPAPIFAEGDFEVYGGGGDMFELSTEQAGQTLTQPTLFVMGFNGDFMDAETLAANPVYSVLPAFQNDSVYELPYWSLRGDYDEALATLDHIEELFG